MLKTMQNPENFIWSIPFFGRGTIFFGCGAESFAAETKQYTAFFKFLGGNAKLSADAAKTLALESGNSAVENERLAPDSMSSDEGLHFAPEAMGLQPKESKPEIKVFTFGLFFLRINSRVRAGFIKRHQILVEA